MNVTILKYFESVKWTYNYSSSLMDWWHGLCCSISLIWLAVIWHRQHFLTIVLRRWQLNEWFILSLYRSVIVAPKKAGMAPSVGTSAAVTAATAASVSSGTPIDSVAVVSSGDASQSTSADSAGSEYTHTHTQILEGQISHNLDEPATNKINIYLEILLLCVSERIILLCLQFNPVTKRTQR